MRGTLDQLEFDVIKYEVHPTDNRESKVYLSKRLTSDVAQVAHQHAHGRVRGVTTRRGSTVVRLATTESTNALGTAAVRQPMVRRSDSSTVRTIFPTCSLALHQAVRAAASVSGNVAIDERLHGAGSQQRPDLAPQRRGDLRPSPRRSAAAASIR